MKLIKEVIFTEPKKVKFAPVLSATIMVSTLAFLEAAAATAVFVSSKSWLYSTAFVLTTITVVSYIALFHPGRHSLRERFIFKGLFTRKQKQ